MNGRADIHVIYTGGQEQKLEYFHQSPLRVFVPYSHAVSNPEIVLGNIGGGIVAGDEFIVNVGLDSRTALTVATQAAEKVYRSSGPVAKVMIGMEVGSTARLKWIPQETILFDGIRLRRRISLNIQQGGSALAGEILYFGRSAKGELITHGLVHEEWRVRYAGKLLWADNLHLADDIVSQMNSAVGFNGSNALASLVYVSENAPAMLEFARSQLSSAECRAGATLLGKAMIVRWLGRDPAALRRSYVDFIVAFDSYWDSAPGSLPQVWQV